MAARPPTSAKQHGHGAGNRPRSNGPPLTVATVKYGNNAEMTINLDCRFVPSPLECCTDPTGQNSACRKIGLGNDACLIHGTRRRLLDLHLVLSTICNGEAVDLISDKGQV